MAVPLVRLAKASGPCRLLATAGLTLRPAAAQRSDYGCRFARLQCWCVLHRSDGVRRVRVRAGAGAGTKPAAVAPWPRSGVPWPGFALKPWAANYRCSATASDNPHWARPVAAEVCVCASRRWRGQVAWGAPRSCLGRAVHAPRSARIKACCQATRSTRPRRKPGRAGLLALRSSAALARPGLAPGAGGLAPGAPSRPGWPPCWPWPAC